MTNNSLTSIDYISKQKEMSINQSRGDSVYETCNTHSYTTHHSIKVNVYYHLALFRFCLSGSGGALATCTPSLNLVSSHTHHLGVGPVELLASHWQGPSHGLEDAGQHRRVHLLNLGLVG